jgi:hypothetical protein
MKNRPHAADLLTIAREAFHEEILPALPERLRYTALMIGNALVIARREMEGGEAAGRAEIERLCRLLGETPPALHGSALQEALAEYNRRLATDIRAGRYDDDPREVLEHLRRTTEEKLAISNPKALNRT